MMVQSLRLSSIYFLVLLMFSLGGCNYLEKCKNGDIKACMIACEDKEICKKACDEGNFYACREVYKCDKDREICKKNCNDKANAYTCGRVCNNDNLLACTIACSDENLSKHFLFTDLRTLACKELCDANNDRNACERAIEYWGDLRREERQDFMKKLCNRGYENACQAANEILKQEQKNQEWKQRQQAREEEERRRSPIYQSSPRGRCENTCNKLYNAYSETWNYCMSGCRDMRDH